MIGKVFEWLFSGGIGYVQGAAIFGLVVFVGFHWTRYHNALDDVTRLKGEKAILALEVAWKDMALVSSMQTQARRDANQSQQRTLEDAINAAPTSNDCGLSPAIRLSLGGVRDRREDPASADP
jgi:hypothetical protein